MNESKNWAEYLKAIAKDDSGVTIARRAGVPESTVSRWRSGTSSPSLRQASAVARAYGVDPLQAFVAAGLLDETDVDQAIVAPAILQLRDFTDVELAAEMLRRITEKSTDVQRDGEIFTETINIEHPAMNEVRRRSNVHTLHPESAYDAVAKSEDEVIEIEESDERL